MARGSPNTSDNLSPTLSSGNNMEFCFVMSRGHMGKCGEMRKDGGASTASRVSVGLS